ncbi:MAG: CopG family transcriptional regulator [Deltaproteobacteria bacterium]|nr:CopG family transcriptional regulator [Deltaproteobacteria bacterium]
MKTLQTEIPDQLYDETMALVTDGWFRDTNELFREAIRRFVDSHRTSLMEKFVRDDVKWGLDGKD